MHNLKILYKCINQCIMQEYFINFSLYNYEKMNNIS